MRNHLKDAYYQSMLSSGDSNYHNIRPAILMNIKDSHSAVKPMPDMLECGNENNASTEKRKVKSMVVQKRHQMGNPVTMLTDYVLPLVP